jgi:hypothetical protein
MSKYNSLLKKIEVFEKLAVYGDRGAFLRNIAQDASYEGFKGSTMVGDSAPETAPSSNVTKLKETVVTAPEQMTEDIQKKLNDILTPLAVQGKIFFAPLKLDGILGGSTRQALDTYKKQFGLQNASHSDVLKDIQKRQLTTALGLDDAAKAEEAYRTELATPPGMGAKI